MQVSILTSENNMFDKFKNNLLRQQDQVEAKIASLDLEESSIDDSIPESSELGTASWQEDVRTSRQAVKGELLRLSKQIKNAISKMNSGTYGKCEKCKKQIELSRLTLLPTAALCIGCM